MPRPELTAPVFKVLVSGREYGSVELDSREPRPLPSRPIGELQWVDLELRGRETGTQYRAMVGDFGLEQSPGAMRTRREPSEGTAFGDSVRWAEAPHFANARGIAWVHVDSKLIGSGDEWQRRGSLPVLVVPSKLSEERYRAMWDELCGLVAGIVFDLLGKSSSAFNIAGTGGGLSARSSQMELRLLEAVWEELVRSLQDIERNRHTKIVANELKRRCWGAERISRRGLRHLVERGIDPRDPRSPRPFSATVRHLAESCNTYEHAIIAGILGFLAKRVRDCRDGARRQIQSIEDDRPLRDIQLGNGPTLYESIDRPRVEQLEAAIARADAVEVGIHQAQNLEILRDVHPVEAAPNTTVFRHVEAYRRFRLAVIRYLQSSLVILDAGLEERVKSTDRLYEQWVFLQIISAFAECGLSCEKRESLVRRMARHRYSLDLERGTSVFFRAPHGRAVVVSYEPWIRPRESAATHGDTVFREGRGTAAWSPDVLIEFLAEDRRQHAPPTVEYAVVVDAKYSATLKDDHFYRTEKYQRIRSLRSERQVVRQIWLAFPDEAEQIAFRDELRSWGPQGPDLPRDETAMGGIGLVPGVHPREVEPTSWVQPRPVATAFARGLLTWLRIDMSLDASLGK